MKKRRKVEEFEYPVRARKSLLADLFLVKMLFRPLPILWALHISMMLQMVTGAIILFGGSWINPFLFRRFHGYGGIFFTLMFVLYLLEVAVNENFRALHDPINYIEIVFYAGLILFGFSFSTIINLGDVLSFISPYATLFHNLLLPSGWILASLMGDGVIVHALASIYFLIERVRSQGY